MKTYEKKSIRNKIVRSMFAENTPADLQSFEMVDNPIGSESGSAIIAWFS